MDDESTEHNKADNHLPYCIDLPDLYRDQSDSSSDYNWDINDVDEEHLMCGAPGLMHHNVDSSSKSDWDES